MSTFPATVDAFVNPGPTDPRTAPALSSQLVDVHSSIVTVETWLKNNIYAPAGGVQGQFLQLDVNGHPIWSTVDVAVLTNPTFKKVDDVHEGAQINLQGSGANPTWAVDVFDTLLRVASGATIVADWSIGQSRIRYAAGAATLRLDSGTTFATVSTNSSDELITGVGGQAIIKQTITDIQYNQPSVGYLSIARGVKRIFTSTVSPTSGDGNDGDVWLKYT